MTQEMWKLFPQMITEKINGLLHFAVPNRMRAYQIYKSCQNENLWKDTFSRFTLYLDDYFRLPVSERSKGVFDAYLERPMHRSLYEMFELDFRSAHVDDTALNELANWTHHMMRLNCRTSPCLVEQSVFEKTFTHLTNPGPFDKASDLDFDDFCSAWKKMVFQLFGRRYDHEISRILNELKLLERELHQEEQAKAYKTLISLTQTEIDWTESLLKCLDDNRPLPAYPLMRGPQKPALVQIEKIVQLYNIISVTTDRRLQSHLESVTMTLRYRCTELLNHCVR